MQRENVRKMYWNTVRFILTEFRRMYCVKSKRYTYTEFTLAPNSNFGLKNGSNMQIGQILILTHFGNVKFNKDWIGL